MKKVFGPEQNVWIVAELRRRGVPATARKRGVQEHSVYVWGRKVGGLEVNQVADLERLRRGNAWPKSIPPALTGIGTPAYQIPAI